ncbi:protein of unknown function [Nitrospira japonica]|uniref:Helix-turn-helix domain-containing protein n=1 Tax=Nitrospira japonica TaxID=1325564 RepID=A0A1W1I192_9BACT|nr:helix-turn-helix domain-containing protein [Nitrospira japonica]SLM46770.1 protein of unknown function [Nitrospira japonica]
MALTAETTPITRRLLSIQDVAVYTGLSVHTLYAMVSKRRIPHIKLGRLTKFDRVEIDKWIASKSVKVHRPFQVLAS